MKNNPQQDSTIPHITDAEWKVMQLLWEESPRTAKELSACMMSKAGWAGNTTYTLIYRLLDKEAIRHEGIGHGKLYYPCVGEREASQQAIWQLIKRVYRGSAMQMVREIVDSEFLDQNERKEISTLFTDSQNQPD